VQLLERTTRSVRLTESGASFLAEAERRVEGLDRSVIAVREFAASGRGRVSLACLSSAAARLLPPVLAEMQRKFPQITVALQDSNMRGILRSLAVGDCDVAIASEDPAINKNRFEPLLTDHFHVVCRTDHVLAKRQYVSGSDLTSNQCVMLRRDSAIRAALDRSLGALNLQMQIVHETTQVHTALGLAEAGIGIAVMPAMLCPGPENTGVVMRELRKPQVIRRIGLAFPALREPSPAALMFADVFKQVLRTGKIKLPKGMTRSRT
jgi:DNA-binding transcriptional LysR family regulator